MADEKVDNLMAAVKNILLNMCDRGEVYEEDTQLPCHEFALLYRAYAAMGGNFEQPGTSQGEEWPDWEQDIAEDCEAAMKE